MYDVFPLFIFRTPLLPFDKLQFLLELENEATLLQYAKDPKVKEAIYIASPLLYKELQKLLSGKITDKKEGERILYSTERYISRMSTRCTPFGMFAGCGLGKFADTSNIILNGSNRKAVRLDMLYLHELYRFLIKIPIIRGSIRYYPNTSLYKIGTKYRYVEILYTGLRRKYQISEFELSVFLKKLFKVSEHGANIKSLTTILVNNGIPEENAIEFINELINAQIIVPELHQSVTGEDLFNRIIKLLESLNIKNLVILDYLQDIQHLLSKINSGKGNLNTYDRIISTIKKIGIAFDEKYIFQVDTIIKTSNASLSQEIIEELKYAVNFLNKITQPRKNEELEQFKQDFYNRYENREIPLMEALDPDIGIGYPSKYYNSVASPLTDDLILPKRKQSIDEQAISLFRLILIKKIRNQNIQNDRNTKEIILTDEDITGLKENWNDLPPSISAMFQIINPLPNKHLIRLKSCGGSSGANLLSRFAHADEDIKQLLMDIVEKEKEATQNIILAEIVHLPESRVGNILCKPHIRDYELLYMSDSDLPKDNIIYLSDLMLSVKQGRLTVYSKKLRKEIIPRLTNAHNYHNGTMPIYRFLCDLQIQTGREGIYFSWGKQLEQELSFLPRVRYKNTILSLATWKVKTEEIRLFFLITDNQKLIESISKWRSKIFLPRYVLMPDNDNELFIDWENPLSIRSLFAIIKKRHFLRFTEFLFESENSVIKSDGGNHTNEFISIFYKKQEI